jgi:hypothetical protein
MRARARPGAILGLWAWQAALALVVSGPAAALARAAYGSDPRGDAALWAPGGHALLDFLSRNEPALRAVAAAGATALTAAVVAGLVPVAALLAAIASVAPGDPRPGLPTLARQALRAFPAFLFLLAIVGGASAAAIGAGAFAGDVVAAWGHDALGEARSEAIGIAVTGAFLVAAAALGLLHDLARAAVVRFGTSGVRALGLAAAALRRAPRAVAWAWVWRCGAGAAVVLAIAPAAERLGGRSGWGALLALAALHQAVVLARVALRASWLAACLRSLDGRKLQLEPSDR